MMRMDTGIMALNGVMKPMLNQLINFCIHTKQQSISMKEMDHLKTRLGALTVDYYALESVVYMTAALADIYDGQDVDLEMAIVRLFALESLAKFAVEPLQTIGPKTAVGQEPYQKLLRDSLQMMANGETLDSIKVFVGMTGVGHAGGFLSENVKKQRNPFDHPAFIFSKIFKTVSIKNPKLKMKLEHYWHPSLQVSAYVLEQSVLRLFAATDILLARHGPEIGQHTTDTSKIADMAMLCYAMIAVGARASRSYCIGLRNANHEVDIANAFCFEASERCLKIATFIDSGEFSSADHMYRGIGTKLFDSKGYFLEHPTERNF